MTALNSETLEDRREKIAENFARKILRHPEHRKMFSYSSKNNMRSGRKVIIPKNKTTRYAKTTIPSLGHIINQKLRHRI